MKAQAPGIGLRCPHCGSIIYSRRHKLCGVCARDLPAELLFPEKEAERLKHLMSIVVGGRSRGSDLSNRLYGKRLVQLRVPPDGLAPNLSPFNCASKETALSPGDCSRNAQAVWPIGQ